MYIDKYFVTSHAIEETEKRGIAVSDLTNCIKNPQQKITSTHSRMVFQSKVIIANKTLLLRIIIETNTIPPRIITARAYASNS